MRSDAAVNRERILVVARAALEHEPPPTMAAVAREAGVGQGTLYRNFATWQDLVMEVHRTDVAELVEMVPGLLAAHPPRDALALWLQRLGEYGRIKKGLGGAIHAAMQAQLATEGYAPVVDAINTLLDAGAPAGVFRTDVRGQDVLLLVGFLWRLDLTEDRDELSARMLDVVLSGLTAPSPG